MSQGVAAMRALAGRSPCRGRVPAARGPFGARGQRHRMTCCRSVADSRHHRPTRGDKGEGDGRADARGRQPRTDPRSRSPREQPQRRQRGDPQTPTDRLLRGVRVGQEFAGLRHHRRRVTTLDQRDLQHLRTGLHAHPRAPRRGRLGGTDDGDHRGSGAHGRELPLDRRHRHRCQCDAADPIQPSRGTPRRLVPGLLLQRRVRQRRRRGHPGERQQDRQGTPQLPHHRGHVPAL